MPDRVRSGLAVAAAAVVTLLLSPGLSTQAVWSAGATVPGTPLSTGVLDVRVEGVDSVTGLNALDRLGLVPGDTVSTVVTVANAGTVPLSYSLTSSGTDADGLHLAGALEAGWAAVNGTTCGAPLPGVPRSLAPGATERICLRVALPAGASPRVAGGATDLAFTVHSAVGGWTDSVPITGTNLSAVTLTAPSISCGGFGLGSLTVSWGPVPGATAYRIHYGLTGDQVATVSADVRSRMFSGVIGLISVEAVFGSDKWVSPPSASLSYAAVTGLGRCS
jgi:hypothetical protein